jgi:hypothetical protein
MFNFKYFMKKCDYYKMKLSDQKLSTVFLNHQIYLKMITKVQWSDFIERNKHFLWEIVIFSQIFWLIMKLVLIYDTVCKK